MSDKVIQNANKREVVDVGSFMAVLKATSQDADGIRFDGKYMPNGKAITAKGVTIGQVMKDKGMAETWHQSVKGEYERQINETNHERSTKDTPELVIVGKAPSADDGGGGEPPVAVHPEGLEAQLQASCTRWAAALDRIDGRIADLEAERREAAKSLRRAEAALQAVLMADADE